MITNFETNKVFFSSGLYNNNFGTVAINLVNVLRANDVSFELLPGTDSPFHIWARDFMPVQVRQGKTVRFRYEPDYLVNHPEYKPNTTPIMNKRGISVIDSDIILDGGNVISCGNKVIMTDKIFKENPNYPRTALIDMLSDLLEAELVLIPWDRYEEYGHSDGMVRYIGEGRVLLNNYFDFDKYLRKRLINALTPHFDVSELHYGTFTKNSWAYINFLHVGKHVFVPMLSEKVDDFAFCQIADAFSHSQCHPIGSCEFVVAHGGGLNCTTWNVYNSTN